MRFTTSQQFFRLTRAKGLKVQFGGPRICLLTVPRSSQSAGSAFWG